MVAAEPQVQARDGVVDAGTEEVTADSQANTNKDNTNVQASGDDSTDNSADKGQVSEDQQKKDDDAKYLYKRRGRQPPIYNRGYGP